MSAAYSLNLRERVVAAVDDGMSKMDASRTFRLARTTLDDWLALRDEQGHLLPKAHGRRGPLPKISDLQSFEAFAARHEGKTLAQMQSAWQQETGQRVSDQTLFTTLRKIVWTRKKVFRVRHATNRKTSGPAREILTTGVLPSGFVRAQREAGVCGSMRAGRHLELRLDWSHNGTRCFTGSCDAALVEAWFEQQSLPVLQEG